MVRRPEPDDDDIPPSRDRGKKSPKVRAATTPHDEDDSREAAPEEEPPREKTLAELSDKGLLKRLVRHTEEFQMLATDNSQAAMIRRVELTRAMRAVQTVRDAREPIVVVTVPRSVTGEPYILGPLTFHPGVHHVRASVAQYLLWMIGENQRVELNRLRQNGRTIDLGTIGSRARMATISRDDGSGDYEGRQR
jgi:hypothetical protein